MNTLRPMKSGIKKFTFLQGRRKHHKEVSFVLFLMNVMNSKMSAEQRSQSLLAP